MARMAKILSHSSSCRVHQVYMQGRCIATRKERACCGRRGGSIVVVVHCTSLLRAVVVVVHCTSLLRAVVVVDCAGLRTVHVVVDCGWLVSWLRRGEAHQVGVGGCCIKSAHNHQPQQHLCQMTIPMCIRTPATPLPNDNNSHVRKNTTTRSTR